VTRALAGLLCVALGGASALAQPREAPGPRAGKPSARIGEAGIVEKSRVEVQASGKAFKEVVIENALGNVRIEGHDGSSIVIETHKRAPDEETLDRLRVSLVPTDGTVRINTAADVSREARKVPRAAVAIDLVIRAPRDARIDATVASGLLEVVNMDAGGELDAGSGAISVRNVAGELYTHTVSGPMKLTQVFGSVDAATISADVELDTIGGDRLVASANQGQIAGRRVRARHVEITTTTGKVVLEAEASLRGRIVVSSLRGDVDVKVRRGGGTAVRVRAHGPQVQLGGPARLGADGWAEIMHGIAAHPALVELRSHYGLVQFAVVN
jgi:hypothetical protein